MKEKVYQLLPNFLQNILISLYNFSSNTIRYGGKYKYFRQQFKNNNDLSYQALKKIQQDRYASLIAYATDHSSYFKEKLGNKKDEYKKLTNISNLPLLSKEEVRANIEAIYTLDKKEAVVSKTGGTTGKSLEVLFLKEDFQERFAMLDNFRSKFGYELGKKTAWFSGKNILTKRDVRKGRFWKQDYFYNVRYYSTFHIKTAYLNYYIEDLIKYKPQFLVGFPSNMLEIAKHGLANHIMFPRDIVKAIFPTAETVTPRTREILQAYFHCGVYDQYASSEGAPFIFECKNHKLHLELQSGVFEVLDDNNQPAKKGRLVVTSFTTRGTLLIRYDIGDAIELSEESCDCGNNNPLVKQIFGRVDDYVYSPKNGKINLGNVSNTLKDTTGIIKFQVIQNSLNELRINYMVDPISYNIVSLATFKKNWIDRVGDKMKITYTIVNDIAVANSGKYRLVINNVKHLIDSDG